jgi:hypothetical protein
MHAQHEAKRGKILDRNCSIGADLAQLTGAPPSGGGGRGTLFIAAPMVAKEQGSSSDSKSA